MPREARAASIFSFSEFYSAKAFSLCFFDIATQISGQTCSGLEVVGRCVNLPCADDNMLESLSVPSHMSPYRPSSIVSRLRVVVLAMPRISIGVGGCGTLHSAGVNNARVLPDLNAGAEGPFVFCVFVESILDRVPFGSALRR